LAYQLVIYTSRRSRLESDGGRTQTSELSKLTVMSM
jgi:hypothetical protein